MNNQIITVDPEIHSGVPVPRGLGALTNDGS